MQNVAALKQLMEEVATLKAEREVVVKELKDPVSDISEWLVGGNGFRTTPHLVSSSVCVEGGGRRGLVPTNKTVTSSKGLDKVV